MIRARGVKLDAMTYPKRTILVAHPSAELYGSDRVLADSVVGLLEAGDAVVVVLPERGPLATLLLETGASVTFAPAFVLRKRLLHPSGWGELLTSFVRGAAASWRLISQHRPAAVLVNTITLPLWPVIARLRGVPVILHVHEGEASASRAVKRVLYAPALSARRILINSAFSLEVMVSAFRSLGARSIVVPNAVPGPPSNTPARAQIAEGLRVLFVGRLSPRKGVDLIVDALRLLDERGVTMTLDIVGAVFAGYEWYERDLRRRVADAGLADRVRFHGFHTDVWPHIAACDVLVVPSRLDEPFGNTAVEGILAGRPVVVSRTSGLIEATQGIRTAVLVDPGSSASIADALLEVIGRWQWIRLQLEESASVAHDRHSPSVYRQRVAEEVRTASA